MAQNWDNFEMVVDVANHAWDADYTYGPSVLIDGSTYKMWYTGYDGSRAYILYCTSTDGKTWGGFTGVLNSSGGGEGTYDERHVMMPCVIKNGATYHMWYTGYTNGGEARILHATSSNGTSFTGFQLVVDHGDEGTYDTNICQNPWVILDGSTYKMWYLGNDNDHVIYCTSTDGINWTGHQRVMTVGAEGTYDSSSLGRACVLKDDSTYRMWYGGYNGTNTRTIYCDSSNGTSWSNHEMVVDIQNTPDGGTYFDNTASDRCAVIKDGGTFVMWYSGQNPSNYDSYIIYTDWSTTSIGGTLGDNARILVVNEADWSLEANENKSSGSYSVSVGSGEKLVIARKADGEVVAFGDVTPVSSL